MAKLAVVVCVHVEEHLLELIRSGLDPNQIHEVGELSARLDENAKFTGLAQTVGHFRPLIGVLSKNVWATSTISTQQCCHYA